MQVAVYEEHKHFVMALAFNPKDLAKFGSGSMDKTIKIWDIRSEGKANITLTGHKSGINCLDFHHSDKPLFIFNILSRVTFSIFIKKFLLIMILKSCLRI